MDNISEKDWEFGNWKKESERTKKTVVCGVR